MKSGEGNPVRILKHCMETSSDEKAAYECIMLFGFMRPRMRAPRCFYGEIKMLIETSKSHDLEGKLRELTVSVVKDPEKLRQFADAWSSGFHRYSLYNTLLIWCQRPTARLCAGYTTWKYHHRYVKANERGIQILAPRMVRLKEDSGWQKAGEYQLCGYMIVNVFDVEQTEGEPLNIGARRSRFTGQEVSLEELIRIFEVPTTFVGALSDGSARLSSKGLLEYGLPRIEIALRKNRAQMVAAYLHELAHIECEHLGDRKKINRAQAEVEAEGVAYLVSMCIGIENPDSTAYIGHWSTFNTSSETFPEEAAMVMLKVANRILSKIESVGKAKEEPEPVAVQGQ